MAGKESTPVSLSEQFLEQDLPLRSFLEGNINAESGLDLLTYLEGDGAEETKKQDKK